MYHALVPKHHKTAASCTRCLKEDLMSWATWIPVVIAVLELVKKELDD